MSSASSFDANTGHQPPSSATPASRPVSCMIAPAARYTSATIAMASPKVHAPTGITMKSCTSTRRLACAPPPKICTSGIGRRTGWSPARCFHSGSPRAAAAACAIAIDVATVALPPRFAFCGVPSSPAITASHPPWSSASRPRSACAMRVRTFSQASITS